MSEKTKLKVKVKKRKIKVKRIIVVILIIIIFILTFLIIKNIPIKNIYISGNNLLKDREIISIVEIEDYPRLSSIKKNKAINKLKENPYIKDVEIKMTLTGKIYINIIEKKILCLYEDNLLFEDGSKNPNTYNLTSYPILTSDISDIYDSFISKFSLINTDVLLKISEIEYSPNDVDNERFILKMNDGNIVYITLTKVNKINKYNSIYSELEGKKGIIYLDSGDYVELKEE